MKRDIYIYIEREREREREIFIGYTRVRGHCVSAASVVTSICSCMCKDCIYYGISTCINICIDIGISNGIY